MTRSPVPPPIPTDDGEARLPTRRSSDEPLHDNPDREVTTLTPSTPDPADAVPTATAAASRTRMRRGVAWSAVTLVVAAALIGGAGGAGAAGLLTGKNVKDDSLRSIDFGDNSIRAARFRDGSLTQSDVAFDVAGDPGAPGSQGPTGLSGIRAITVRTGPPLSRTGTGALLVTASCLPGEIALAGGAQLDSAPPGTQPYIFNSFPVGFGGNSGWQVSIVTQAGSYTYTPWVVCAVTPAAP